MNTTASPLSQLHSQMQCFALPYGGIGFAVNFAVDWVICFILIDESPWRADDIRHPLMNAYFALVGLLGGLSVAIYSIVRCSTPWPFVLIGVWKLMYIGSVTFFSLTCNWALDAGGDDSKWPPITIVHMALMSVIGVAGAGALAQDGWEDHRMKIVVSIAMAVFVVAVIAIRCFMGRASPGDLGTEASEWALSIVIILCLISDMAVNWILAVAADNISGTPAGKDLGSITVYVMYIMFILLPIGNT